MKKQVEIIEFEIKQVSIPIKGISPLIVHKFSEKAEKMIADKQAGAAKNKKHAIRVPEDDYNGARHISPLGWDGFPSAGFKGAMIRGAKVTGMEMKSTQQAFFVNADCAETQLTRIEGEARMRTDMVRVGMGSADIRYRPEYVSWAAVLNVEFNAGILSLDQLFQIVKAAGYSCGIGEMRPEKGKFGYGRWKLKDE
jgi:hypothetical protein